MGALRRDKGGDGLVDTLLASFGGLDFRTIGEGQLPQIDIERLQKNGITYVGTGRIDQAAFLRELSRVQVVIAPYAQPTESGSVLLCMALGVPVLALESPTMQRILNDASRFSTTAELGFGLARFLRDPWPTFKLTPSEQRKLCRSDLETALGGQSLSRRNSFRRGDDRPGSAM